MRISTLPEVPDCSSVSQLPPINPSQDLTDRLSADTLILVSQRQYDDKYETDSEYLSRQARLDELDAHSRRVLSIDAILDDLDGKVDRAELSTHATLCADCDIPYIISSFYISAGVVTSVDGYPLSDGLSIAIDKNGYVPNRLSTHIWYDNAENKIVLQNFDGTISSYVDRDEILSDLVAHDLSNVTVSKDGSKIYLHFVIQRGQESQPELKKITVNLSTLSPYEFTDGLKLNYPGEGLSGKISVAVDYDQISSAMDVSAILRRISALEARLSSKSFVAYENPIYN